MVNVRPYEVVLNFKRLLRLIFSSVINSTTIRYIWHLYKQYKSKAVILWRRFKNLAALKKISFQRAPFHYYAKIK
jgi:hypothetical protein